jgi:hypothetical protein
MNPSPPNHLVLPENIKHSYYLTPTLVLPQLFFPYQRLAAVEIDSKALKATRKKPYKSVNMECFFIFS